MLTLTHHSGQVTGLAFSPDGQWLGSAGWDGTVRLWERPSFREVRRMRTPFDHAICVAFSHDSVSLAAGFRNRESASDTRGFASFAWTPVRPEAGVNPNSIPSYDTRGPVGPSTRIIAPHPSKAIVALYGSIDEVALWERVGKDCRELERLPHSGFVADLAFSTDGTELAACAVRDAHEGSIYRWSWQKKTRTTLRVKDDEGSAIAYSPASNSLFCAFASGRLVWWNQTQERTPHTAVAAPCRIIEMAFSPDGRTLLLGCEDGLVRLWDVSGQRLQTTFDWVIGSIRCVAFAPDGLTAAVGGDGAILVWDVDE